MFYNYIFTLLSTIEIIIIYFNTFCCIPYFQLLLLCVVISFHDVRKYFPEVRVAVSLCVSLTDEVSIRSNVSTFDQSNGTFFMKWTHNVNIDYCYAERYKYPPNEQYKY
jgi:hypothetical protein